MVGTAQTFLTFNIDGVHMHLLAIEDHLRRLSREYESEEASCLMKHALQLQEQSLEGISHASDVGDKEKTQVFRDLQKGAEALRKKFKERADPDDLIKEVRALRKRAEVLDPTFNLEKCASCGDIDLASVEKIKALQANYMRQPRFRVLEEGMAHAVLNTLAEEDGVQPPELVIDDGCHDPNKGVYDNGKIKVCRSGVSEHLLAHEYGHHRQALAGNPLDEDEAERFAVDAMAEHRPHSHKGLNSQTAKHSGKSERSLAIRLKSPEMKQLGTILGASAAGTVAEPLNNALDAKYPGIAMGQNPSLLVDVGATIGLSYAALKKRKYAIPLAVLGGSFLADGIRRYVFPRIPGLPVGRMQTRIVTVTSQGGNASPTMTRASVRLTPTNGPLASSTMSRGKFAVVTA